MSDVVYIDVDDGLKRVLNNSKLYARLLGKFKVDTNLKNLDDALSNNDIENARNFAHTLKGLAANLSLIELYNKSLELESQLKSGAVNPDLLTLVKDVNEQTLIEVDKVIAQYA